MKKALAIEKIMIEEIKELSIYQQKKILDLVRLLKSSINNSSKKHSIIELKGCGKDIWKGIDAQEYVNRLREEWN
ncbi:MAG: hypothetical protein NTX75_02990 [Proteobacteria bacterium]|nr:hypothetical protein [Pseudomonadota bacterium]